MNFRTAVRDVCEKVTKPALMSTRESRPTCLLRTVAGEMMHNGL